MKDEKSVAQPERVLTRREAVQRALNDPVAQSATASPLVAQRRRLYAESAAGLLAELAELGFPGIEEVGELRRRHLNYRPAVPVLIDWLPRVTYLLLAEDIVRTLSVGFAKNLAVPQFLRLFREPPAVADPIRPKASEPPEDHLKWVIGNGLSVFAGPAVSDALIALALDRKHGQARTQIVLALPKTKDARVPDILLGLLDDSTVRAFAIEALGKMRFTGAREEIRGMLDHSDKNVRDQSKKALRRLGG